MSEKEAYKIFRELEARKKRANPYKFYDKDELIDEILKNEEEIERLNNIIKEVREYIKDKYDYILGDDTFLDHDERIDRKQIIHILEILDKENNNEDN